MIVQCEGCETRYEVDNALLGTKGRMLKCAHCDLVFRSPPAPLPPAPPAPEEPSPAASAQESLLDDTDLDKLLDEAHSLLDEEGESRQESAPQESAPQESASQGMSDDLDLEGMSDEELEALLGDEGAGISLDKESDESGQPDSQVMERLSSDDDDLEGMDTGDSELERLTNDDDLDHLFGEENQDDDGLGDLDDLMTAENSDDEGSLDKLESLVVENGGGEFPDIDEMEDHLDGLDDHPLEEVDLSDEALMGGADNTLFSDDDLDEIDLDGETMLGDDSSGLRPEEEDALGNLSLDEMLTNDEEDALGSLGFDTRELLQGEEEEATTLASQATQKLNTSELPGAKKPDHFVPPPPKDQQRKLYRKGQTAGQAFYKSVPTPSAWTLSIVLTIILFGQWIYDRPWMKYWLADMKGVYRLSSLQTPKWEETNCCQILIFEGRVYNTTRIAQNAPLVKVTLRDNQGNELSHALTAPGRKLEAEEKKSSEEALREMVNLQGQVVVGNRTIPLPKIMPEKDLPFQVIFVNPNGNANRYDVVFEPFGDEAKRAGGTKGFALN